MIYKAHKLASRRRALEADSSMHWSLLPGGWKRRLDLAAKGEACDRCLEVGKKMHDDFHKGRKVCVNKKACLRRLKAIEQEV